MVEDIYQRQQLHRALSLALQLNDTQRIAVVADVIIKVEKKIAQDDKPGLWGFAFKWLVLSNNEKVNLEESVVANLVQDLEDRLNKFMTTTDPDPWHVENIVMLLVPYYLLKKDENNATRILLTLEDAFRKNIHANSDPLLKVHYLEQLDALYRQHNALPRIKEHLKSITNELPTASKESLVSFKEVSGEIKIETKKIKKITNDIFTIPVEGNSPSLSDIRIRIVSNFIGKRKDAAKLAEELSKKFVFMHIMPQRRVAEDGHTEAILPPYEEDPDSHAVSQAFQNIQLTNIFLSDTLSRLREKFSVEEMLDLIMESGLFFVDEKDYLMKGLQAYWTNDPFNAAHTFIPYIEALIRRLIAKAGGITITPNTKPGTYGGYSYRTLGLLLNENEQLIDSIYKIPVTFYLELLLVHPLGWNLRNNFAHGASLTSLFRQDIADRLFHILLLLSLVREEKK